jgi:leukotriene-A4 hydrolase
MVIRPIMTSTEPEPEIIQPRDPNTLSNYTSWRTQHVTANLEIDFEGKRLVGDVILRLKALRKQTEERVILDSRYGQCS